MTLTLTFNPLRAMVMTYSYAKVQGQQSVCFEDRVETNGQTDGHTVRRRRLHLLLLIHLKLRHNVSEWQTHKGKVPGPRIEILETVM